MFSIIKNDSTLNFYVAAEVSVPRGGFDNSLPSAREVSTQVHRPIYEEDANFTVMLAIWGQFIDHDISATALSRCNGSI